MAGQIAFDDLIPAASKRAPSLPARAPALPASMLDVDPRTARVVPLAAPAASASGVPSFDDLIPGSKSGDAYQKAYAREQQRDSGPIAHARTLADQATAPFMPYVQGALGYASQGLDNLQRSATGQPIQIPASVAGQAAEDYERNAQADWAKAHPAQAIAGDIGDAALVGPARAGTMVRAGLRAPVAPYVPPVPPEAATLAQKALNFGKTSLTGAGIGGAFGAAQAPDGQHLAGMARGAAFGAAAPAAFAVAGKVASPVVNGALRIANKASGGRILDPAARVNQVLAQTLAADFRARGVAPADIPAAIQNTITNWRDVGAPAPNLMDVAGENTRAAMRTAASQVGPGRTAAQEFADKTAANLQGQAINRTRALTPNDNRPASVVSDTLTAQRQAGANADYRAPYAAMVDPAPVVDALTGETGARGINRAYTEADAMRLGPQMQELNALRAAANPQASTIPPVSSAASVDPEAEAWAQRLVGGQPLDHDAVSLGTLDRLKVAYNNLGDAAAEKGAGGEAAGYYGRAGQIDDYLANLEGPEGDLYRKARDNYAKISGHIDAMKAGDINVANEDPDLVNMAVAKMTPEERNFAQIQLRQNLTNAIGSPTEGAVGALNKIATSDNATRNLATIFGEDTGSDYQSAIKNMVGQVKNASFVAPNTGPKSANVLLDADAATRPHHMSLDPMDWVMAARRAGMLLTPQESEMLVKAGQATATPSVPMQNQSQAPWLASGLTYGTLGGTLPGDVGRSDGADADADQSLLVPQ